MKKNLLKFVLPILLPLAAVFVIGPGCGPGPSPTPTPTTCDTTATSQFMNLYNSFGTDVYSYDLQVYEYTFSSSVNGSICAIGYQGHPNLTGVAAYKIEIIDKATNAVLSTGAYSFAASARSYQSISTVNITAGTQYIMRRTVINTLGDVSNTISHFKQIPSPFVPIVHGNLTIHETQTYEVYSASAPYNITINGVLPCIDFVLN